MRGGVHANGTDAAEVLARLFSPAGREDPYPSYHRLRELAPLHRAPHAWYATRYHDCARILRDPRFGKGSATADEGASASVLMANPPDHTRLRNVVSNAFTPRIVQALRARLEEWTDELLDAMAGSGEVDFMGALAFPLTLSVIGEVMGVPPADRPRFERLNRDMTLVLEAGATDDDRVRAAEAVRITDEYYRGLFAERRDRPREDLVSMMVAAHDGGMLSEGELFTNVKFVFGAGFETSASFLGNAVVALVGNPDQLQLLRRDPSLVPSAVEELLRYDNSIHIQDRRAFEDVELDGEQIGAGEHVVVLLGAANRDPDRYREPDRLDVTRTDVRPLSFGGGIHFCVGAALARLEAAVVLSALVAGSTRIDLAGPPVRRPSLGIRGFTAIPVEVSR